jgi:hypothetical protein
MSELIAFYEKDVSLYGNDVGTGKSFNLYQARNPVTIAVTGLVQSVEKYGFDRPSECK